MKLFRRIEAQNVHGIYLYAQAPTPAAIEAVHKFIVAILETGASDSVKIEALKTLIALTAPAHKFEVKDCTVSMGA